MSEAELEWTTMFLPCKLRLHAHPNCEDATIMFTLSRLGLESILLESGNEPRRKVPRSRVKLYHRWHRTVKALALLDN